MDTNLFRLCKEVYCTQHPYYTAAYSEMACIIPLILIYYWQTLRTA